jgi:hypothetical protein
MRSSPVLTDSGIPRFSIFAHDAESRKGDVTYTVRDKANGCAVVGAATNWGEAVVLCHFLSHPGDVPLLAPDHVARQMEMGV